MGGAHPVFYTSQTICSVTLTQIHPSRSLHCLKGQSQRFGKVVHRLDRCASGLLSLRSSPPPPVVLRSAWQVRVSLIPRNFSNTQPVHSTPRTLSWTSCDRRICRALKSSSHVFETELFSSGMHSWNYILDILAAVVV